MKDEDAAAGDARDRERPMRRLALHHGRAGRAVPLAPGAARRLVLAHELVDHRLVLRMDDGEPAGLRDALHPVQQRVVRERVAVVVHEELDRGKAGRREGGDLVQQLAPRLTRVDVEGVVDDAGALRLREAALDAACEREAEAGLDLDLVDERRHAPEGRRDRPAREGVVVGILVALGADVDVTVDRPREHELPRGVDLPTPAKPVADTGYAAIRDPHIREPSAARPGEATAADDEVEGAVRAHGARQASRAVTGTGRWTVFGIGASASACWISSSSSARSASLSSRTRISTPPKPGLPASTP